MRFVLPSVAVLTLSLAAAAGHAATIAWSPANNIVGDADVSTLGTPVYAYTFGTASQQATSVNGVNFAAFPVPFNSGPITIGNVTARETQGPSAGNDLGGSSAAPYANLTAGYRGLLDQFISSGVVESIEVTMGGLTVGQTYQVQGWVNLSFRGGAPFGANPNTSILVNFDSGVTLDTNVTEQPGGLGQYAIGTFVADATQQVFLATAVGGMDEDFGTFPVLNGFQLRAVPEPATLAALAAAAAFGLGRRRRA